jgi:hypothetical protein
MLIWVLLAANQITMRKVEGWRTLTHQLIDKLADPISFQTGDCVNVIPTQIATAPRRLKSRSTTLTIDSSESVIYIQIK